MIGAVHCHRGVIGITLAVITLATLTAVIVLGGSPERVGADQPKKVGKVISLNEGKLKVKVGGEGKVRRLAEGDGLRLGDEIIPGKGVEATLTVKRPKGFGDKQLIFVDPGNNGVEHTVSLQRTGKRTTEVTIVDSATN